MILLIRIKQSFTLFVKICYEQYILMLSSNYYYILYRIVSHIFTPLTTFSQI